MGQTMVCPNYIYYHACSDCFDPFGPNGRKKNNKTAVKKATLGQFILYEAPDKKPFQYLPQICPGIYGAGLGGNGDIVL